jgi:invasion protein IalB
MKARNMSTLGRVLAAIAMATLVTGAMPSPALAQQPPAKAQPKAQPKSDPKPGQAQQPQGGEPQITYSAWIKVCQKGPEANAKRVCFTGRDGRIESGMPVIAAVLIEADGDARKLLRVTLPLGVSLRPGTRVVIDSGQPMTAPYVICVPNGCVADYEASGELIAKMKTGQVINVQAISEAAQPISLSLPLADFAKAYDGPPTDPKTLEQPKPQ